jgi:hypothetical protein
MLNISESYRLQRPDTEINLLCYFTVPEFHWLTLISPISQRREVLDSNLKRDTDYPD